MAPRGHGLGSRRGHHRLPRRRGRDHVRRRPHPGRGRRAGGAGAAVRVAGRDVADQLPAARPRGDGHRPAAGHRGAGRRRRGPSRPRPGSPCSASVGEYESALDADRRRRGPDDRPAHRRASAPRQPRQRPRAGDRRPWATGGRSTRRATPPPRSGSPSRSPNPRRTTTAHRASRRPPAYAEPVVVSRGVRTDRPRRGVSGRAVAVGVVLLLLLGAGAVAAVTVLPTADITVTPQIETIGPIDVLRHGRSRRDDRGPRGRRHPGDDRPGAGHRQRRVPRDRQEGRPREGDRRRPLHELRSVVGLHDPGGLGRLDAERHRVRARRGGVPARRRHLGQPAQRQRPVLDERGRGHGREVRSRRQRRRGRDPGRAGPLQPQPRRGDQPVRDDRRHARGVPRGHPAGRRRGDRDARRGRRSPSSRRSSTTRRRSRKARRCSRRRR